MSNIDIELNLDDDSIEKMISKYIKENMSNASYELYLENFNNGFMFAAANALRNEALVAVILEGMSKDV